MYLGSLLLLCLLAGCGVVQDNDNRKNDLSSNELVTKNESKVDDFTFRLRSEKAQYKEGEPLQIAAELLYEGEGDIVIGHGGSWVGFNTINLSKDYHFGYVMDTPYIPTPISSGETLTNTYSFSGATYHEGQSGEKYSEDEFNRMADGAFPPGIYKIEAQTDFVMEGENKTYNIEGEIIFEVVEEGK